MISIITITYNRKALLKKAIDSVLAQSFTDFEYIIVDDGSTDSTAKLITEYNDKRINYIVNPHTGILTLNRNTGIEHSKGNIIAFLDSDDYWADSYLQEVFNTYKTKDVIATISNGFTINEKEKKKILNTNKLSRLSGNLIKQSLLNDYHIMYPSCFTYKKNNLKFNENLKWGENDFFNRIIAEGKSCFLTNTLVYIQKHTENISSQQTEDSLFIQAYNEEYITLDYLKRNNKISNHVFRKAYSYYLLKQANSYKAIHLYSKAKNNFFKAFIKYPLNVSSLIIFFRFNK